MSPYLQRIRSLVGHELLLLPSVTVLMFDEHGRVLLGRHTGTGRWVAPGGMVEPDEAPSTAAIREAREETGCDVELKRIIGVFGGPEFRVRYANGDEVSYVMTVYEAAIASGVPGTSSDEVRDVRFVSPRELDPGDTAPWLLSVLSSLERG